MARRWWVGGLALAGLALTGSSLWHLFGLHAPPYGTHAFLTTLLIGGSGIGLLMGARWHLERSVAADRVPRVLAWMIAGGIAFVGVGVVSLYTGSEDVTGIELLESVHVAGSTGLAAGLFVGTMHVRAVEGVEAATRAEARAELLEAEQERLERLNDRLRHYVLNGVNVVTGYTAELRSSVPEEDQYALDAIRESAETMATLVRHVRAIPSVGDETAVTTVDVATTVESVTDEVASQSGLSLETPRDVPPARTSETFGDALYLLVDGLRTVADAGGTIRIDAETTTDEVALTVTATPAELSRTTEESLFEPVGSDVGLEFYLSRALLDDHGDLRLVESSDDVVRFELSLERDSSDASDENADSTPPV